MAHYLQNQTTGKLAGSIGDGKNKTPTSSPQVSPITVPENSALPTPDSIYETFKNKRIISELPTIIAKVKLEVWVNDNAVDTGEIIEFDATKIIQNLPEETRDAIIDSDYQSDAIYEIAVAEGIVKDHDGPFTVYIKESINQYQTAEIISNEVKEFIQGSPKDLSLEQAQQIKQINTYFPFKPAISINDEDRIDLIYALPGDLEDENTYRVTINKNGKVRSLGFGQNWQENSYGNQKHRQLVEAGFVVSFPQNP